MSFDDRKPTKIMGEVWINHALKKTKVSRQDSLDESSVPWSKLRQTNQGSAADTQERAQFVRSEATVSMQEPVSRKVELDLSAPQHDTMMEIFRIMHQRGIVRNLDDFLNLLFQAGIHRLEKDL